MGNAHILSTYFCKTDVPNEWKMYAFLDGKNIEPGVQSDPHSIPPITAKGSSVLAEGVITSQPSMVYFDDKGNLLKVSSVQTYTDSLRSIAYAATAKFNVAKEKLATLESKVKEAAVSVEMYQEQYDKVDKAEPRLINIVNDASNTLEAAKVALDAVIANRDGAQIDKDDKEAKSIDATAKFNEQVDKDLAAAKEAALKSSVNGPLPAPSLAVDFGGIDITAINPDIKVKDMTIKLNFASSTQFASPFIVNDLKQNGLPVGSLSSVDVDPTGVVFAKYSNGYSKPIGQVALVNFANPLALEKISGTTWKGSSDAGQAVYGQAGGNNFGAIRSSSLENSNVDLSEQLVKLIVAQQAYQANSQAISIQKTLTESVLRI
jgi:flagellar hook protein FlgE